MKTIVRLIPLLLSATLFAQTPFVTGLLAPSKIAFTAQRNLIVAESGVTTNGGRISLIDRTSGTRRTLVDGLPSAFFNGTTPPSPSGPSGLALQGSILYVSIGNGDTTVAGPVSGSEVPNPAGPSSPIFSSVLSMRPSTSLDLIKGGFVLLPSQHATLKSGSAVTLTNSASEQLEIRLVANFPDITLAPRPDFAANVKNSNPFGLVAQGSLLYVVDASNDLIRLVDLTDGSFGTLVTFPRLTNPTSVGPPVIDTVPDSIRIRGNKLLVTNLTGFPFPDGLAEVRAVDMNTGAVQTIISGLTSAIDVAPLSDSATTNAPLLALEFSTNMVAGAPGRLRLVAPGVTPTLVAGNLITPTNMAVDRTSGDIFITNIGPGMVTRIQASEFLPAAAPTAVIAGAASTSGAFGSRWITSAQITNPYAFPISGRLVFHPAGIEARNIDPALSYVLAPYETKSYADLVSAIGGTGLGSVDVIAEVGGAPVTVVRVIDDSSPAKVSVQIPLVNPAQALIAGTHGSLATPSDAANWRFNVGIRALEQGVTMNIELRDSSGALIKSVTKSYPPNYFIQMPVGDLMGAPAGANSSLVFSVTQGSAVIYGAGVENSGRGMTLQIASPANE